MVRASCESTRRNQNIICYTFQKGIKLRYTYTKNDIDFLKEHYPNGEWKLIQERFPTLSRSCIYKKCWKMGIKSQNEHRHTFSNVQIRKKWSESEINIVKENYSKIPLDDLCVLLPNRNKNMIKNQAKTLKLTSYNRNQQLWKKEEIQFIIDNWEITPDKIIATQISRTFRAVKAKREELGLYRQNPNDSSYPTLSKYLRGQNQQWKKDSMLACNYQCVLTGSKDYEIHHLYGVSNIINDILNIYPHYKSKPFDDYSEKDLSFLLEKFIQKQNEYPLGVCVEKRLHILFHSMYGQYYNTPEQWMQFCSDFKKGMYKEYL